MADESSHFTHFDASGQAHMVDVSGKDPTKRVARAGGRIAMRAATLELIRGGGASKGDVLGVARRRVVLAEGSLDTTLRLGRVARLERPLRGDCNPRSGTLSGDGCGKA